MSEWVPDPTPEGQAHSSRNVCAKLTRWSAASRRSNSPRSARRPMAKLPRRSSYAAHCRHPNSSSQSATVSA
eukprot:5052987-Pyramimonas_sp.AAC.1